MKTSVFIVNGIVAVADEQKGTFLFVFASEKVWETFARGCLVFLDFTNRNSD